MDSPHPLHLPPTLTSKCQNTNTQFPSLPICPASEISSNLMALNSIYGSHRCQYISSSDLSSKLPTNKFNSLLGISTWLSHVQNRTLDLPSKPILYHSVDGNSVFPVVQTKTQDFSWLFFLYPRCREILSFTLKAYSKSNISHNLYLTCSSETSLSASVPTSITACLQFILNPVVRMTL